MTTYAESLRSQLSAQRQFLYFWLTRWPAGYLFLESRRFRGNWDKRVYLSFVDTGDTVLDIGANFGLHTLFLSHLVGKPGKILSFEPVSTSFDALRGALARRARFSNVQTFNVAIGYPASTSEKVVVNVPGGDFGQASLRVQSSHSWEKLPEIEQFSASITSIDQLAEVRALDRIDFVKIDIEGGEMDALKGAQSTIREHCPLIYCELYDRWTTAFGYTPAALIEFVRTLGYTEARVFSQGKVYPMPLDVPVPAAWFATSADALFFSERHRAAVRRFDRRFARWLIPHRAGSG